MKKAIDLLCFIWLFTNIAIANEIKCPSCGANNPKTMKFCGECGTKLATEKVICSNCGAEIPAGMKFCGECGHRR